LRAAAAAMKNPETRTAFIRMAETYEVLSDRLDERERADDKLRDIKR
jgi:hypothetical protein